MIYNGGIPKRFHLAIHYILSIEIKWFMVSNIFLANPLQASTHSIYAPKVNRIEEGQMSLRGKPY